MSVVFDVDFGHDNRVTLREAEPLVLFLKSRKAKLSSRLFVTATKIENRT